MKTTLRLEGGKEMAAALEQLSKNVSRKVQLEALEAGAGFIQRAAADLAPRSDADKEHLADNIVVAPIGRATLKRRGRESETVMEVGPAFKPDDFFYGCVFGSGTWISTSKGQRTICQIKVGDMVLTQAGDYRAVTATYRYPATAKPNLVTITARYRADLRHTLTVTTDHKVLAFRDGKFQWVAAGTLVVGDVLSHRKKTSWSEGAAAVEPRICEHCGETYRKRSRSRRSLPAGESQGKRFCSAKCRALWLSGHHRGMKRSKPSRDRMSVSAKARLERDPESHPNRIMAAKGYQTGHERVVAEWLTERGIEFHPEHRIGGSYVDFYLPGTNTVIEADGAFWHQDQSVDIARDKRLLEHVPGLRIVHMHFVDPRFTPKSLVREPLPRVSYVPCNPGPSSFVDPATFEDSVVLGVKRWRYEQRSPRACAQLYDLAVEGVHSFVASGLVIHNSFQEFGTATHPAQPYMRPAFDQEAHRALFVIKTWLWDAIRKRLPSITR